MSSLGRVGQVVLDSLEMMKGGKRRRDTLAKTRSMASSLRKSALATPNRKFDEGSAGTAPDFDKIDGWIAHPGRSTGAAGIEDANHLAATGALLPDVEKRPCDCFFVVDSCLTPSLAFPFTGEEGNVSAPWVVPFGSKEGTPKHLLSEGVFEQMQLRVAANASCFNHTCRIYAPKYRQVSIMSMLHFRALAELGENPAMKLGLSKPHDLRAAFEVAYSDVRQAFLRFVDDLANASRPFILAGHSQGAMLLVRLLQEEIETHPERRQRFVHAYVAGAAFPLGLFTSTLHHIQPSTSALDTCSVSSWRTAASKHPNPRALRVAAWYANQGWQKIHGPCLANNPITWSSKIDGPTSDPDQHLGALWPTPTNVDLRAVESGRLPSGTALRLGNLTRASRGRLGLVIPGLEEVDCGSLSARTDSEGILRVPHLPAKSLLSFAERDWLLYHDLDFALFHNNLRDNVKTRVKTWTSMSCVKESLE